MFVNSTSLHESLTWKGIEVTSSEGSEETLNGRNESWEMMTDDADPSKSTIWRPGRQGLLFMFIRVRLELISGQCVTSVSTVCRRENYRSHVKSWYKSSPGTILVLIKSFKERPWSPLVRIWIRYFPVSNTYTLFVSRRSHLIRLTEKSVVVELFKIKEKEK